MGFDEIAVKEGTFYMEREESECKFCAMSIPPLISIGA
jgi:hypothetical protein